MRRLAMSRLFIMVALVACTVVMVGGTGWTAPVPSQTTISTTDRPSADTAKTERALVQSALVAYGLAQDEAQGRVDLLTDAEVHAVAADLNSIQPAGDHVWNTTEILLLVIVVILLVS